MADRKLPSTIFETPALARMLPILTLIAPGEEQPICECCAYTPQVPIGAFPVSNCVLGAQLVNSEWVQIDNSSR